MADDVVYTSFLQGQRLAFFEYLGEGVFRPIGSPPAFLTAILGRDAANAATLQLGDSMPFLDNFVADAEEFWNSHSEGKAESGAWIEKGEDGSERALEASAVWLAGRKILLLQNPQERYDERVRVLQTAHDLLLESELKYRTLFDTANDAILLVRRDRLIDCNSRALMMFGCRREQIVGAPLHEFSPPLQPDGRRSTEKAQEKIGLALAEGGQYFEWEHCRRDGTPFMAEVSLNRLELGRETVLQAIVRDISDRKRAEEALRQSEATIHSVFRAAPVGICIMKDRVFQSANDLWYEIIGYSEAELLGQTTRRLYESDEEYQRVGRELYTDLPKRGLVSVETRLRRSDGTLRDAILTAAPLNPDDPSAGNVVAIRDVTEPKRTEEARRESERKYQELVEHANSIILHWARDGRVIFLNEFGQRFFGYTQAEICGRHVIGTIVPETDSGGRSLDTLMDEICANPAAFEQNVNENMRRNGERVWIAWTNKVVLDPQGQVAEILSIGVDITARKKAEEAFQEAQGLLNEVGRIAGIGGWKMDLITRKATWTQSTYDIVEIAPGEPIPGPDDHVDYYLPEYRPQVVEAMRALIEDDKPLEFEAQLRTAKGNVKWCRVLGRVVREGGMPVEVYGTSQDITERKGAEEQVRRLHEELQHYAVELEQRVTERTAELAVARDRAEAADRTKSAFLATMSHELRTPLNSIIGFTGLLLQGLAGPLNAEQTKQLRMVKDSGKHLLALINDVLDISKIEAGQIEIANAPFDLPESIRKVVETVTPLADKKRLPLTAQISPDVSRVTSDRRRVEQILLNLLSNAIKFTEHGQVMLTAEIVPGTRDISHSAVRISLTDTGLGIKRENLDKLFQPFRQLDTGLTRQHEGTGLGLAICKRLVERLGGTITVESAWGKGSTFQFTLPVHPERKS